MTGRGSRFQLAVDSPPPITWGYWVLDRLFLAGAYPGSLDLSEHRTKVSSLLEAGIRTFINLTEPAEKGRNGQPFVDYRSTVEELTASRAEKPRCLRYAIRDQWIPTPQVMTDILDCIDASLAGHRPVFVHCWGGVGRTGTVVGCWLMRHGLATPEVVLSILERLRQQDCERGHRRAPENNAQCRFVWDWLDCDRAPRSVSPSVSRRAHHAQ